MHEDGWGGSKANFFCFAKMLLSFLKRSQEVARKIVTSKSIDSFKLRVVIGNEVSATIQYYTKRYLHFSLTYHAYDRPGMLIA
jgi:hypothetical protein